MAKIRLGNRPANFKKVVQVPTHDDPDGHVEAVYKYRTLTEYGAFVDEYAKKVEAEIEAEKAARDKARSDAEAKGETYAEPVLTNEELRKKQAKSTADYLMGILDGWNLDEQFSAESVLQLCDELPAVGTQIINDYRVAITEGRLGN